MKKKFIYLMLYLCITSTALAADWEQNFISVLTKAKQQSNSAGLGYHLSEEIVLEKAIKEAIDKKGPPCEIMKIAVDLNYSAYGTIKNIYSYGEEILLDQLCMCATEAGITKQLITKAAVDAVSTTGKPIYSRDEIAQAQCFNSRGLGYTESLPAPPRIEPPEKPNPFSVSTPK